jgi:hypothetical protein
MAAKARVRAELNNQNDEQNGKEKNMNKRNEEQGKDAFWWLVWTD